MPRVGVVRIGYNGYSSHWLYLSVHPMITWRELVGDKTCALGRTKVISANQWLPLIAHRFPKDCPKIAHGLPTDCPQIIHRLSSDCPRIARGLPTDCPHIVLGLPSDCPQIAHRLPTIALGLPSDCPRIAQRLSPNCPWIAHGFPLDCIRSISSLNTEKLPKDCSRASIHSKKLQGAFNDGACIRLS